LKEIRKNGECIFLKKNKCSVYKARPTQCRTWPFWPENMSSKTWNKEIVNFCPGVGKGKLITKNKINSFLQLERNNAKEILKEKINYQLK
jgi:Fe-S-cluster containining protein